MQNPFEDPAVQDSEFVKALNKGLGPVYADSFWESEPGTYVSMDACRGEWQTVTLVMTPAQFRALFRRAGTADLIP